LFKCLEKVWHNADDLLNLKLRLPEGCMASVFFKKAVTVADFTKHFSAFVKNRTVLLWINTGTLPTV